MKRAKVIVLLLAICCCFTLTAAAQGDWQSRHTMMRSTTEKLLNALKDGDTATLVNMLDTGYNHLNKPRAHQYFSEDALLKCGQYKKITAGFAIPSVDSLRLSTDKTTRNTICILPMTGLPNSLLNIRTCALVVSFYPPKLFSLQAPGQCLGFYFDITPWRKNVENN